MKDQRMGNSTIDCDVYRGISKSMFSNEIIQRSGHNTSERINAQHKLSRKIVTNKYHYGISTNCSISRSKAWPAT